ncbi:MAG TPA: oligoendopeptidase F [Acidaminococcaceae bacterium]|nr:oligoendopeptidase F [Acidaminococcaceae bacterium]
MNTPEHGSKTDRKDIPAAYKWKIEDIYASPADWEKASGVLRELIQDMEALQGSLSSRETLLKALRLKDHLSQEIEKIYAYARLQQDADNGNAAVQALAGKAESLLAAYGHAVSFVDSEILALKPEERQALIQNPDFSDYDFYLKDLERQSPHILPSEEEALLAQSQLATTAGSSAFRALVSADMAFPDITDGEGNPATVSEGSYMLNMSAPDRVLRENSFRALMGTYGKFHNTLAATLTGTCRSSYFYARARHYKDTMEACLAGENIPASLYRNLIDTIHRNLEPLHEYIRLKKAVLGYDELHYYDLYVPLSQAGSESFACDYGTACAKVLEALQPLGKDYVATLRKGMDEGWIDIYENKGKRSGAYSWGLYDVHPYVLLNFQPRYSSISTIAHELGHSLHSWYSARTQPYAKSDYTIFCAEVTSTTNENLLLEYMLQRATKEQKIYLLNQFLEAVRTTVYRQVQFAEFEQYIHDKITAGGTLQAEDLENNWRESNRTYYGPALFIDPELGSEWSRIPHFYTPFYVYKYATGYAAATAFSQAILDEAAARRGDGRDLTQEKDSAVALYLEFLHSGGSDYSLNLLKRAGVDLATPAPVQITLDKFAVKLAELKELLGR